MLLEEDMELFTAASLRIPAHNTVTVYYKIHLINFCRTIIAKRTSRRFLRDNSGIVYVDGTGAMCYGRLKKLLLFESDQQQHAFAVIQQFNPAFQKLCKDSVTDARLDDHITTLRLAIYKLNIFITDLNYVIIFQQDRR